MSGRKVVTLDEIRATVNEMKRRAPGGVDGGGDGPHNPAMEARVARLEDDFRALKTDLSAIRTDVSYLRGRIESLPTTWQMIATVIGGNISIAAVIFAALKAIGH